MKERQELLKQIEEYKRLEAEQLNRLRSKNKSYQEDLVQQIKFQQKKKDLEIDEARREMQILQVIFGFDFEMKFFSVKFIEKTYLIIFVMKISIFPKTDNLIFPSTDFLVFFFD